MVDKTAPEETTPAVTEKTATKKTAQKQDSEKFSGDYYKALGIKQGKNGDKKRTDLNGNPIN